MFRKSERIIAAVHQHVDEPARLDLEGGVEGDKRAFIDGREQRLGSGEGALGLAVHHGGRAHEGGETGRIIGRAAGHLVAFGIPWLDDVGILGLQHPGAGGGDGIIDHLVDDARGFRLGGVQQLAFQKVGRGPHGPQLAHKTRGAACAGEDADHDFGQADLGLGVIGGKDAMGGQRQFKADAHGGAGQGGGDGFAALQRLGVHARAFDFAQGGVHLHDTLEQAARGFVACVVAHFGQHVQVHAAGEVFLARSDHDAFDGGIGQRVVNEAVQMDQRLGVQHVHGFAGTIPGDGGDAFGIFLHGEIGHVLSPERGFAVGACRSRPS